jgi:uncharacterized protein YjbI with pentapeptide repeats
MIFATKQEVNRYIKSKSHLDTIDFTGAEFQLPLNFKDYFDRRITKKLLFKGANFQHGIDAGDHEFLKELSFEDAYFREHSSFKKCKFRDKAIFGEFNDFISFGGSQFFAECIFKEIKFHHYVGLNDCTFNEFLDLSSIRFLGVLSINDSIFEKGVSFEGCDFREKVNAWNLTCKDEFNSIWADFRGKLNLTDSNLSQSNCNFYGANFEDNAYFYKTEFQEIELTNSVINRGVFFLGSKIIKSNRETFRIVKNSFLEQNNKIEANKYKLTELTSYTIEVFLEIFSKRNSLKSRFNSFGNFFVLGLNYISNLFGQSWFLGLIFTLTMTLLFFSIMLGTSKVEFVFDFSNKSETMNYFFQFLNITNWDYSPYGLDLSEHKYGYTLLFTGRIFISYGYYQTIQAFRKYGSK